MRKKRKRNNRIQHLLKIICLELVVIVLLLLCFVYILPRNPVSEIILDFIEEKPLVVLDAGHGGYDVGSEFNGVYEKNITLEITKKVGEELERRDIPVTYTRDSDHVDWPSDELQDLEERVHISNTSGASLFISIHTNATETKDEQTSPLHVLHYNELPAVLIEAGFLESKEDCEYLLVEEKQTELAKEIADGIENTLKDMGVLQDDVK